MDVSLLTALAEPNRLRIVELLAQGPRTVGEIASGLGLRQPQVTKHLQTMERAGLVTLHVLGRRKVCALRRLPLGDLAQWAGRLAVAGTDDAVLERYGAAVAAAAASADSPAPQTVRRTVPVEPATVWRAFTRPALASRWWHPRHFAVETFRFDLRPGGSVVLVLSEGDGSRHTARGQVLVLDEPRRLSFTLDPSDADGRPLFTARHDVLLTQVAGSTDVEVTLTATAARAGAEAALGGLAIGWEQLLDNLSALAAQQGLADPANP